jgi:hypothetical protein
MRETFSRFIQTSKDFCIDPSDASTNGLTSTESFLKREINKSVMATHKELQTAFKTKSLPRTASTTAGRQYYYNPPGLSVIDTATIDNDTTIPPLRVIQSQVEWDRLNSLPSTSGIPSHIFMRARDFGLFPIPQTTYTLSLTGRFYPINMTNEDYSTGTVAVSQNSQTVTGTNTTFTAAMVGRYFVETDSDGEPKGNWYRISAFSSTTSITLETYFEEATLSGSTYLIGESPELPDEVHEFIPYRVAAAYYGTRRRDTKKAQEYLNYYFTGDWANTRRTGPIESGVLGYKQEYSLRGSDNTQILDLNEPVRHHYLAEEWETVTT